MIIRNVHKADLQFALDSINEQHFNGNVMFNRCEPITKNECTWRVTLRVKDSHADGAKISAPSYNGKQRHTVSACWHVHGYFFDALPGRAIIKTSRNGNVTTHPNDAWNDLQVGSMMYPVYMSELCDC